MQEVTHPEVLQAVQVLKSISASPQERRDAEMRLKYHRDITAIKSFGWQEGRQEGQLEGKSALLLKQITFKFGPLTPATLAQIHTASPQQLDHWAEQILTASDLDSLLSKEVI